MPTCGVFGGVFFSARMRGDICLFSSQLHTELFIFALSKTEAFEVRPSHQKVAMFG